LLDLVFHPEFLFVYFVQSTTDKLHDHFLPKMQSLFLHKISCLDKTFDAAGNQIVLKKPTFIASYWADYLLAISSDRSRYVCANLSKSGTTYLTHGIPQCLLLV